MLSIFDAKVMRAGGTLLAGRASGFAKCAALLALLSLLALPLPARADLDPGLKTPYDLQVVVDFARHRVLTTVFQDHFEKQLHDLLHLTYRELANIKVVRTHALLDDIRKRGLQQVLDGWEEKYSPIKTHFLRISYQDGKYHLEARQHDGMTGLSSPVVRKAATADRRQLARLAALLIDRDFGLRGTVMAVRGDTVDVAIQGGQLTKSLDRWIRPGDVLAVCRIYEVGNDRRIQRLDWGLLRVQRAAQDGICQCQYFYRFEQEQLTTEPGVAGYRCLKLTTTSAPLSLHLIAGKKARPLDFLQVGVGQDDFDDRVKEWGVDADGRVQTTQVYSDVAFVRVMVTGTGKRLAKFPVPIVDDRTITCPISLEAEEVGMGSVILRHDRWLRRIYEDLHIAMDRVGELNATLEQSPELALKRAQTGLENLRTELQRLQVEKQELSAEAARTAVKLDLKEGEQRLAELAMGETKLQEFIQKLQEVIQADAKTRKIQAQVEQGRLLEVEAKYDEAIALYQRIVEQNPEQTEVAKHLAGLKKVWDLAKTNPELAKARAFIYNTWPAKVDTPELETRLKEARQAFEVTRKAGDRLSPRKMLSAIVAHTTHLKKWLDVVRRRPVTEDNRAEIETIRRLAQQLQALDKDIRAWVGAEK